MAPNSAFEATLKVNLEQVSRVGILLKDLVTVGYASHRRMRRRDIQDIILRPTKRQCGDTEHLWKLDLKDYRTLLAESDNLGASPPCRPDAALAVDAEAVAERRSVQPEGWSIYKDSAVRNGAIFQIIVVRVNEVGARVGKVPSIIVSERLLSVTIFLQCRAVLAPAKAIAVRNILRVVQYP